MFSSMSYKKVFALIFILTLIFFSKEVYAQEAKSNTVTTKIGDPTGTPPGGPTSTAPAVSDPELLATIKNEFGLNMTGNWPVKYLKWIYEEYHLLKQTNPNFIRLIQGERVDQCNCSLPNQEKGYVEMSIVGKYENDRATFIATLSHELGHAIFHNKPSTVTGRFVHGPTFASVGSFSSYASAYTNSWTRETENYAEIVAYCLHGKMVGGSTGSLWENNYRLIASQFLGECRR